MGASRYHTNDEGKTLPCTAESRECRFIHGSTPEEAAANWQDSMASELLPEAGRAQTSKLNVPRFPLTFRGETGEALKLDLPIDPATQLALNRLLERGFSPLVAGGAVRDSLLGNSPKDFDIEVHGAESFAELRRAVGDLGTLNLTGKSFGVMKLRVKLPEGELSEEIDLSLPRRDSKIGDGHRGFAVEVDPQMGILEATSRRDLTVNALLWDPNTGLAMDFHGGFDDMDNRVLRHVSPAFSEDPLRVIRVARFASKLGFTPAAETVDLSRDLQESFDELPTSRISGELSRMVLEPAPAKGFDFLRDSGWGDKLGLGSTPPGLSADLARGLKAGKEQLQGASSRRVLQLSILASNHSGDSRSKRQTLEHFSATKAETSRALAISSAPSCGGSSPREARQWAWDNQTITAREKILLDGALSSGSRSAGRADAEHFEALGILDGHEADRFDSAALIKEHRDANPGLKDGPWIRDVLQKHRTIQYER